MGFWVLWDCEWTVEGLSVLVVDGLVLGVGFLRLVLRTFSFSRDVGIFLFFWCSVVCS